MRPHINRPPPPPPQVDYSHFFNAGPRFIQFFIVFIFSLMLKINELLKRTEKEKTVAELSFLKAQINPHFLFNSLNSIYSMALEKSDMTAEAVVKLSGIMRYIISDASNDFVPLQKEVDYISDYIELQKYRLENTVKIVFETDGDFSNDKIAPLILIPFIENTFKHGVNSEEQSEIFISIANNGSQFQLKTANNIAITQHFEKENKLGMYNTRRRLESTYPGKHQLKIEINGTTYNLELNINLL